MPRPGSLLLATMTYNVAVVYLSPQTALKISTHPGSSTQAWVERGAGDLVAVLAIKNDWGRVLWEPG